MVNDHIEIRQSWPLIGGNPGPYLQYLRDTRNAQAVYPPERRPAPRSKHDVDAFVAAQGGRAPETLAHIVDGKLGQSAGSNIDLPDFLSSLPPGQYFCKPDMGGNGIGAFRLERRRDGLLVEGERQDEQHVAALLSSQAYVVQKSLVMRQHPDIARFNSDAISTIRLVTFDTADGVRAAAASLRSAAGKGAVDNWSAGGVVVPIDLATARLTRFGVLKRGLQIVETHPSSGLAFDGAPVPSFDAAVTLACSLHEKLAITSLGWDIALLDDGPCVIEYNRLWDIYLSLQLNPGFLTGFLRFHLPVGDAAARLTLTGNFGDHNQLRLWLCAVLGRALASARIDEITPERLVLTVGGAPASVEAAIRGLSQSGACFQLSGMKAARRTQPLPAGFDVSRLFSTLTADAAVTLAQ